MTKTPAFLLGGVSQKVATYASCSVLICKGPILVLSRILLAVDGSEWSDKALTFLSKGPFKGPLHIRIMTVWASPSTVGQHSTLMEGKPLSPSGSVAQSKGQDFLQELSQSLTGGSYDIQTEWQEGDPPAAILEAIPRHQIQIVVMGARGLKGMKRFLLGSVSQKVLTHAPCSVLIVR